MADSIFPHGSKPLPGQKFLADSRKTSALLTSACASAGGWDSKVIDAAIAAGPCVMAYVWDQPTRWTWCCAASLETFNGEARRAARAKPDMVEDIRGGLGTMIYHAATSTTDVLDLGASWENVLGQLMAGYAGTTQAWALNDHLRAGGHFVVLHYRKPTQKTGLLRPVALPQSGSARELLSVEDLLRLIAQVEQMDRARHPDWFA